MDSSQLHHLRHDVEGDGVTKLDHEAPPPAFLPPSAGAGPGPEVTSQSLTRALGLATAEPTVGLFPTNAAEQMPGANILNSGMCRRRQPGMLWLRQGSRPPAFTTRRSGCPPPSTSKLETPISIHLACPAGVFPRARAAPVDNGGYTRQLLVGLVTSCNQCTGPGCAGAPASPAAAGPAGYVRCERRSGAVAAGRGVPDERVHRGSAEPAR
jgi:hypothetical protein